MSSKKEKLIYLATAKGPSLFIPWDGNKNPLGFTAVYDAKADGGKTIKVFDVLVPHHGFVQIKADCFKYFIKSTGYCDQFDHEGKLIIGDCDCDKIPE